MTGPAGAVPAAPGYARPAASTPVIRRGDNVRVTIDTQSFSISYAAIAAEDGRVGETITLRGDDRKSKLSANVTGPGRAILQKWFRLQQTGRATGRESRGQYDE